MLIGRNEEKGILLSLLGSDQSEFVAVYGRRRVGKTYLVRETFNYRFAFQHTGLLDAPLREQIDEFCQSLFAAGLPECATPKSWPEAFRMLQRLLASQPEGKKVVFIDEMPWMDTPRSGFLRALDHFWNGWATMRRDIILIVCGSATSWIINNIVSNYGGLHDRVTRQIWLKPFTLHECELYCQSRNISLTRKNILEGYMAMGGIPYYWHFLQPGLSMAQNFDRMFFAENGEMTREYDALYASLFKRPKTHIAIVNALATKKAGMLRNEIIAATKSPDNSAFATALSELEQNGFIRQYTMLGKKRKDAVYQLMDNYTLFYFKFIAANRNGNTQFWTSSLASSLHDSWAGLAFERVCLQHLPQIRKALGFSAVVSTAHSWTYPANTLKDPNDKGVQIDLLIDRNDDVINLCEMKYTSAPYTLSAAEHTRLMERRDTFVRQSGTRKAVHITMITTYGLTPGGYANDVQSQVTLDDLFAQ